jgi:hypothetical protein
VRTFSTSSRARRARRARAWPPLLVNAARKMAPRRHGAVHAGHQAWPFGETLRAGRRLPLLALPGTAASARELSPRPAAPAERRNDRRQARKLQERAILPAPQCEAGQDHPQERFASRVMAYGHPCG